MEIFAQNEQNARLQFGTKQMQQHQQATTQGQAMGAAASSPQAKMLEGAQHAQQFFGYIANTTADDRAKIVAVFPKLSAFLTGANSQQFLSEITALMTTISAAGGQPLNAAAIQTQAEALKTTLKTIWQEYSTANAASLQAASTTLGMDIGKQLEQGSMMPLGSPSMIHGGAMSGGGGAFGGAAPNFGGANTTVPLQPFQPPSPVPTV